MTSPSEIAARDEALATVMVLRELERLERKPFRKVLADLLGCAPTKEAIRAFSEKHPDRWAQALSIVAGLAGYERGVTINLGVLNVAEMSDAALFAKRKEFGDAVARAIDVTPAPAQAVPAEAAPAQAESPTDPKIAPPSAPGEGHGA